MRLVLSCMLAAAAAAVDPVSLEWEEVTCRLGSGQGRKLLDRVSGTAQKGKITAIMGPSGSGKTLLLSTLCGQVRSAPGLSLEGRLRVNGMDKEPGDLELAFVKQDDTFYSEMTVRETLRFHAKLRMAPNTTASRVDAKVDRLLAILGLAKSADTPVGSASKRGISGGERKRLSVACELISEPALIFLDEPLSGLDSFQATNVMQRLRRLADGGHTVVLTLHQPSAAIYSLVDNLVLLSEGKLMYTGPVADATAWLTQNGVPRPNHVPPSEHLLDAVSVDFESSQTEARSRARIDTIARAAHAIFGPQRASKPVLRASLFSWGGAAARGADKGVGADAPADGKEARRQRRAELRPRSGVVTQFRMLFARAWRQVSRAKGVLAIKLVQQVMMGVVYGGIYAFDLSQRSIQDRLGLLSLVAVGASNLAIASTIRTFPSEKALVMEEREKRLYGVLPYFLSKLIADVPLSVMLSAVFGGMVYPLVGLQRSVRKFAQFLGLVALESLASSALGLLLGSVAPSTDAALAMFPPIVVLMVIFNGLNLSIESTPKALRWVPDVSLVRWAFEGLAVNEFQGLKFEAPNNPVAKASGQWTQTGERALDNLGFGTSSVRGCAIAQSCIIGGCWAMSLRSLQTNRPRMAQMKPPGSGAIANSHKRKSKVAGAPTKGIGGIASGKGTTAVKSTSKQ